MKCEHEGCEEKSAGTMRVEVIFPDCYGGMCRKHLAAWLREKANEVERVKKCPQCEGSGINYGPPMEECQTCDGTGKVPR